jgi:uncharacterized membrane protein YjfL (UPF0719 family)
MAPALPSVLSSPQQQVHAMEWTIIGLNFLYAFGGLVLMWVAYKGFDLLTPTVPFDEELRKGNIAVAIFVASIFISIALIIGGSLK